MDETKNLSKLTAEISENLLNSMIFLEILKDIIDGETKEDILISNIFNNIDKAYKLLTKAQNYARKTDNLEYMHKINTKLNQLKELDVK